MDKEILQADQQILEAKQSLAGTNEEHLQISVQMIQLEKTIRDKAIDEEVEKAKRERAEGKDHGRGASGSRAEGPHTKGGGG